jgi:hypothetical protein
LGKKTDAVNPPPDVGYPGFNTAEGSNALNTGGNTAKGAQTLLRYDLHRVRLTSLGREHALTSTREVSTQEN